MQGSGARCTSELLWGSEEGKGRERGSDTWQPVIPGPAQPKTVTVCLCLPAGTEARALGRVMEASRGEKSRIGAYMGSNGFQGICFSCPLS